MLEKRKWFWSLLALSALALAPSVLTGCQTRSLMVYETDGQGEIQQYKRYAKYVAVDLLHRFRRKAYHKATPRLFDQRLSPHQEAILSDLGEADLYRRFKSRENELVTEWVFLDAQRIAQFVEGQLAYDGPLKDYEKTLIRYGYPDRVTELQVEGGGERAHWLYKESLILKGKEFSFSNDDKIYQIKYY